MIDIFSKVLLFTADFVIMKPIMFVDAFSVNSRAVFQTPVFEVSSATKDASRDSKFLIVFNKLSLLLACLHNRATKRLETYNGLHGTNDILDCGFHCSPHALSNQQQVG